METAHLVLSTGSAQTVLGAPKRNPGVTPQMLTLQLRQLEADEIVTRKIYAEVPARVEYQLTAYGQTLSTLLRNMQKWGEQHFNRRTRAGSSQ